nr:hypothetical protein [Tanacetum cinerariifolium]
YGFNLLKQQRREKGYVFVEIVKLCDAMLERVLKEVKLEIFETGFWKKASLLDEKVEVVRE